MTTERHDADHASVTDGSENVFADLGLPSSQEDMIKVYISRAIADAIRRQKLTQAEAASLIGIDPARVSDILRGRLKRFNPATLMHYLVQLGPDVNIQIVQKRRSENRPGQVRFMAA